MSGTDEVELAKGIEFILNNPEYGETKDDFRITNIEIKNKCIYAYSYGNNKYFKDRPGKLPVPLSIESFISMAVDWWKSEESYDEDSYFDGTIRKGFLLTSGKDYGAIHRDDGGYDAIGKIGEAEEEIQCDNLHDIIIAVNNQYYGK